MAEVLRSRCVVLFTGVSLYPTGMVMFGVGKGQWLEGAAGWGWGSLGLCSKMSFPSLWKECMQYTDRLEEAHCFVCGSVFVSVVEDVFCICRLWVIVLYVKCMCSWCRTLRDRLV